MKLYHYELELHENLFFATREMGRLYECERYLHNYALTYALGLAAAPYFQPVQIPSYQEELSVLNERRIYVTPAIPIEVTYYLTTFKYADNNYHVEMTPARTNTPSFGRAKEIAVGSRFHFGVLFDEEVPPAPCWLRLGLWRSKAHLQRTVHEMEQTTVTNKRLSYPLNPLDVPDLSNIALYDLISMRPTSLLDNVRYSGSVWRSKSDPGLLVPANLAYRFPQ